MISDYSDEDADAFDDDDLLTTYIPPGEPRQNVPRPDDADRKSGTENTPSVEEWPQPSASKSTLRPVPGTLAWFKATPVNQRLEAEQILRAWASIRTDVSPDSQKA